ncbi:MAG TPA: hypothetical protein VLD37_02155 [Candidatus Bilamarchaeum sp.]|nr:hypothetical protein [Candidatus Bilamarchaeum sp.]
MKKTEFALVKGEEDKLHSIDAGKHDDYVLPEFTREVPLSSRKKESGDTVSVEYDWKASKAETIRVKRISYRKEDDLSGLYRIAARDGADSISFRYNNATYILRKTVREIAEALYNAYGKIKGALENIVGFLRTEMGSEYVVAKVEKDSWAFDRRIAKAGINYVDVDGLERKSKSRLVEMITEKLSDLHKSNLIIGRFTLNNILLGENDVRFTDLRKLRVSRKRAYVIDEFKSVLQYLFAIGLASRDDIYCSIAYYTANNEEGCTEWYSDQTGRKPADQLDVVSRIEEGVYS